MGDYRHIGKATPRKDARAIVTGSAQYIADLTVPGMLYGRVLRSPYPHARITHIDVSKAEAYPGVAVVLTYKNVPKWRGGVPFHRPVLNSTVYFVGDAVALIAAETEKIADEVLELIEVEYEQLPGLFDPYEAMAPGAVPIYDEILLGEQKLPIKNNIACHRQVGEGDVEQGFKEADLIVEREFKTGRVYHAQMETKSVVCRPEADGGITVWPTAQSIHNTRQLLGRIFNIPLSRVNVHRVPIGGAFGSSIQMNTCIPICVALALKAQKPVKLVLSREEDMYDHCKYPSIIKLK